MSFVAFFMFFLPMHGSVVFDTSRTKVCRYRPKFTTCFIFDSDLTRSLAAWQPWQLRVLGHSGIAKLPPESLQGLAKVGNSRDMALEAPQLHRLSQWNCFR